ncbi:MAG: hypothetical protein M1816_001775 [Peltula sp. TS41687]|nr:MAG: hypothetical protein M1816_001775 [Peltula sp. TS41687]
MEQEPSLDLPLPLSRTPTPTTTTTQTSLRTWLETHSSLDDPQIEAIVTDCVEPGTDQASFDRIAHTLWLHDPALGHKLFEELRPVEPFRYPTFKHIPVVLASVLFCRHLRLALPWSPAVNCGVSMLVWLVLAGSVAGIVEWIDARVGGGGEEERVRVADGDGDGDGDAEGDSDGDGDGERGWG